MSRFNSFSNGADCVCAYFIRLTGSIVSYLLPFRRSHPTGKKARSVRMGSGLKNPDSRGQYRKRSYRYPVNRRARFLQSLNRIGVGPDSDGNLSAGKRIGDCRAALDDDRLLRQYLLDQFDRFCFAPFRAKHRKGHQSSFDD